MFTILKRRSTLVAAPLAAAALVVAGCGSASGGGQASAGSQSGGLYGTSANAGAAAAATAATASRASVDVARSKLGPILVNAQGRTLYLFKADRGPMSTCTSGCANLWPPLTTHAKPAAGQQVSATKLGTTRRSDGSLQVTYNGHPLYLYAGDRAAGQTTGEGNLDFGAEWDVLSSAGNGVGAGA